MSHLRSFLVCEWVLITMCLYCPITGVYQQWHSSSLLPCLFFPLSYYLSPPLSFLFGVCMYIDVCGYQFLISLSDITFPSFRFCEIS